MFGIKKKDAFFKIDESYSKKHENVISCIIYYISCMIFPNSNFLQQNPANIHVFKVNNRNTGKRCEICSKSTIKIPERRQ